MIRHVAAAAVVLCLIPSWVSAQSTEFTVNLASANVHKAPSTGSPVLGKAPRGTVLEVTRELGDWVKVTWTEAPDSAGYLHVSSGSLRPRHAPDQNGSGPARTPGRAAAVSNTRTMSASPAMAIAVPEAAPMHDHSAASSSNYITPPAHGLGFGGRVSGSTVGFGATARGWSRKRLGLQLDVSRYALTSPTAPGRVTSLQVAPSVLYSLPDRVTDYFWLRPYVGAGVNLSRSTQAGFGSTSKSGFQAFGGGEMTFASVPRFAVSADVGYRSSRAPFDGFELGGMNFSISGHWYVR